MRTRDRYFRLLVRLLPSSFRNRHGDEVIEELERMKAELGASPSIPALLRLYIAATADLIRHTAWPPRGEAYRRFGGVRNRERARGAWGVAWMEDLLQDGRLGVRRMTRSPGFSGMAILTLALGIGGTVALFSVAHGLLLRHLPFSDDERLVVFWSDQDWRGVEFDFVRERVGVYDGLAAYGMNGGTLRSNDITVSVTVTEVSADLFDVLGARPLLGRTFLAGEDRPGGEPVVVISHSLWRQELGADPGVVGRRIVLDGAPVTVVGVMPPGFYFPVPDAQVWRPLLLDPASSVYQGRGWLVLLARMRPNVTDQQLAADLSALGRALGERFTYPEAWDKTKNAHVRPLREYLMGDVRPVVLLLLGAVGLLLFMATANVAALLLARMADRTTEMDVRASLGAGRGRLARQVFAETVLLAVIAGVAGGALALVSFDLLIGRLPLRDGFTSTLRLEWPVLIGGVALAAVAGVIVALAPMRRLLAGAGPTLHGSRSQTGSAARRAGLQGVLVGAEIVVAVLLVTGATLFTRSVGRLYDIDLGLEPEGVGAVTLVAGAGDLSSAELGQLYPRIVERIAALPGVRSAGLTVRLPLRDGGYQGPAEIESRPDLEGPRRPNVYWRSLTPGYFATLGIEVLDGRDLTDADRADAPQVALVNERFAREMWPGESALGKRVYHRGFDAGYVSIVGVVEDVPITGVRAEVPRVLYRPAAQASLTFPVQHVVFRTSGDPAALFPSVRTVVRQMDPRLAVTHPTTLEQVASSSIGDVLQLRFFLSALGGLALVVGCVGVYGVVSYSVSRRRAEYGVRMALGADAKRVVVGVLKREMLPIVLGTLGGLTAALLSARAVASLVWGVRPWDPASLATGAAVLLVVGLAAAFVPALRASDVSPSDALRRE